MRGRNNKGESQTLRGKVRCVVSNYAEKLTEAEAVFAFLSRINHTGALFGWMQVVTGPSVSAGDLCSSSENKGPAEKHTWESGRSAECRVAMSEDQYSRGCGYPRITDCLNAVTPGDVYLFTTNGPSLKSHRRRNRLNAGPGETGRGYSMKDEQGIYIYSIYK